MYLDYWGLAKKPFESLPDPGFLCETRQHAAALQRMEFAVEERLGVVLLTGTLGSGKTLLTRALVNRLDPARYQSFLLARPPSDPADLLREIARALGENSNGGAGGESVASDLIRIIRARIEASLGAGFETVLVLDEAHLIDSRETFENLRLMLNTQKDRQPLFTLIMAGQPELPGRVDLIEPLVQKIGMRYRLGALARDEAHRYVSHRLAVAGCDRALFTDEAVDLAFDFSDGIPRQINRLCALSLLSGFTRKARVIDEPIVWEQVQALTSGSVPEADVGVESAKQEEYSPGPPSADSGFGMYHSWAMNVTRGVFFQARRRQRIEAGIVLSVVERMLELLEQDEEPFMEHFFRHFGKDYLFAHALNVAGLNMLIARRLGFDHDETITLGLTGLLHDIGLMKKVDHRHRMPTTEGDSRTGALATSLRLHEMVGMPRKLTDSEREELNRHPHHAYETVSGIAGLDPRIAEFVLQHRERIDGEGYPRGLSGDEVHPHAQVTALCCVFESLTHPRQHRGRRFPDEAMKYVTSLSGKHFARELVAAFLREVGMYPLTCWVELSSGEVGRVVAPNPGAILRPVVEVTHNSLGRRLAEPRKVDLSQQRLDRIVRMLDERID